MHKMFIFQCLSICSEFTYFMRSTLCRFIVSVIETKKIQIYFNWSLDTRELYLVDLSQLTRLSWFYFHAIASGGSLCIE